MHVNHVNNNISQVCTYAVTHSVPFPPTLPSHEVEAASRICKGVTIFGSKEGGRALTEWYYRHSSWEVFTSGGQGWL